MAGSRLEYIGTIFSRTTGLLRTKAIKYEDRPIWYDIYRVFPPKFEPRADRLPELGAGMTEEVPAILYSEDISRAALFKKFGKNPGGKAKNLMNVAGDIGGSGAVSQVVTVDTLISMFKNAKDKQSKSDDLNKDDKT